jgi:pyruvate/2-oxoglutarate dehydrogenase complex dihydrolipoamide acyltransferase (E2) component
MILIFVMFFPVREIVTDDFDALYALLKPKGVTVSAMLAKAVAETLKKHPIVNAAYVEGGIKYSKGNINDVYSSSPLNTI